MPAIPDRPIIGGPTRPAWPDRPIIGGGNNNNINININRPGWGWSPGWGWGHPAWNNRWHWHHPWYHGSWNGHWWNHWYRPPAAFFVGWGLGSWSSPGVFVNPYFVPSTTAPFDYSQPIVINNFVTADASATATADAQNTAAMQLFDEGMTAFRAGQYEPALAKFDQSLAKLQGDPVLHEMRALTYFALGRFQPAAAVLNSLLAAAPGMDWTTLSSLYGNLDDYTTQLRALEAHVDANPNDPAALFLLSYHYLVMGHDDQAIDLLRRVVKIKPNDTTAQRLLRTLEGPGIAAPAATGADAPETDLVGRWQAMAGDTTIELTIDERSRFGWTATQKGKPPVSLAGNLATTSDLLILDTDDQGSMVGQVRSGGADKFDFIVAGGPPTESGLSFQRQK